MSTPSERAWALFPAGSPGEYNLPRELTVVLARGQGATVWDTDGRAFTDFTMGWGSVILGHAHPAIVEAVRRRVASGSNFAYLTDASLELAEELARAVPCAERLRFCASGTEATAYAVRLARAFTGRSRVLKFEGAYHGANEVGTVSLFPRRLLAFPQGEPTSAGIPAGAVADVLVAPYNDLRATTAILTAHRHDVAAVIVEPLHRCTPPQPGFLAGLRELTAELGVLLIFDETVTGFRLAYGGAQEYYGVRPDLATFGKALGGGYPIGVVAGRADVLDLVGEDRLGEDRYVWFASSIGGNPSRRLRPSPPWPSFAVRGRTGTSSSLANRCAPGWSPCSRRRGSPHRSRAMGHSRRSCSPTTRSSTTAPRSTQTGRAPAPFCWASSAAGSS